MLYVSKITFTAGLALMYGMGSARAQSIAHLRSGGAISSDAAVDGDEKVRFVFTLTLVDEDSLFFQF